MSKMKMLFVAALTLMLACDDPKSDDAKTKSDAGGKTSRDATVQGGGTDDDGQGNGDDGDDSASAPDAGTATGSGKVDAGKTDTGGPQDASVPVPVVPDGAVAMVGMGSCCTAHDTPGCNNADLMVCVCEKYPECCTTAWEAKCTFVVEQKFCQPEVRDCVCDNWDSTCCGTKGFTSSCDTVARTHCMGIPGCS